MRLSHRAEEESEEARTKKPKRLVLGRSLARWTPVVFAPDVPALDAGVNRERLVLGLKGQAVGKRGMAVRTRWGGRRQLHGTCTLGDVLGNALQFIERRARGL